MSLRSRWPRGSLGRVVTPVFVFDTLQYGYPLQQTRGAFLGRPIGRYRSVRAYPLVVNVDAFCANPDCGFEHRCCGLLNQPGRGHNVEGDVFELDDEALAMLDEESGYYGWAARRKHDSDRRAIDVEPIDGGPVLRAETHFNDPNAVAFMARLANGRAELLPCFTIEMARGTPKQCCLDSPGHSGPHVVTG
jgi:hypothetical protein